MFLIVLGVLLLVAGFIFKSPNPNTSRVGMILKLVGTLFLFIGVISSSIKQIDAGNVGVKKLFGKVDNDILESGLHFVNPLVEIEKLNVKTQNYTMSGVHDEGDQIGDDAIKVLSADGLEVIIDLTVLFKVVPSEAPKIISQIGPDYVGTIVRPIARTKIRDNAVYYDAISLYSTKRDEFQAKIFNSIEKDFKSRGLFLEQLLVRNITLPESVKAAIESKINAEQEAQKMQFVLSKERQEAERKRVEAQGIADYNKIMSAGLTEKQLQYEMIKMNRELAGSPNAKIIIMGNSGKNGLPVVLTDK
jgi:regulator of protease activity HflC (stomatin/prohibitin superfamily)